MDLNGDAAWYVDRLENLLAKTFVFLVDCRSAVELAKPGSYSEHDPWQMRLCNPRGMSTIPLVPKRASISFLRLEITIAMTTAVLLIAHGSRRAEANHDLVVVADRLRGEGDYSIIVPSYLELADPSIPDGARQCVEAGADHVLMMPYFLSAGSHVTRDLERFRSEASAEFETVKFDLCPPLGLHPLMLQIVKDRLTEAS